MRYIITIIALGVSFLMGCNNDLPTPYVEAQGWNDKDHATVCETGHIADVKDLTVDEIYEGCYYAQDPDGYYQCWAMYQGKLVQVLAVSRVNGVAGVWFEPNIFGAYAATLCTNSAHHTP